MAVGDQGGGVVVGGAGGGRGGRGSEERRKTVGAGQEVDCLMEGGGGEGCFTGGSYMLKLGGGIRA